MKWDFEEKIVTRHVITCDYCSREESIAADRPAGKLAEMLPGLGWTINEKTGAVKCGHCNWNAEQQRNANAQTSGTVRMT